MATGRPQLRGHKVKPKRPQIKHECGCGRFVYMPANQARQSAEHGGDICSRCAGRYLPASLEDCAEYAPTLIHLHGDYVEDIIIEAPEAWGNRTSEGYCECSYRMPADANPDHWFCPKCRKVNERHPDGTMMSSHAPVFGVEWERANGLTARRYDQSAAPKLREQDTYAAQPDIPF